MHPSLRALLALAALLIAPATAAAAPSITLTTPADGAVYATAPAVHADFACAPDSSTLAAVTQCEGTVANGAAIDTATAGTKAFTVTATDADGATSSVTHTYTVDSTAPAIALTTPAQGAVFASGEAVSAAYACADAGGAGVASCTGTVPNGQPLDTTPGTHTFTVTAIDNAGNTTTVTHSYRASICSRTGAHAVSCELWARAGTIDLPGMPNVPDQDLRRPQRCAGDHAGRRSHPRRARRRHRQRPAAQRPGRAARARRAAAADGSCDLEDRTRRIGDVLLRRAHGHLDLRGRLGRRASRRSTRTSASRSAQGLYGALVVRPAAQTRQAYGTAATAYDEEALMLLSDIDPALNANPDTFDMSMFAPTYALINGRPYDGTANGTLPIVSAPGHDVLLRVVNAAVRFHPIGLLGLRESVVGESSHALRYPRSADRYDGRPGQHGRRARAPARRQRRRPGTTRSTTRASASTTAPRPAMAECSRRSTRPARGRPSCAGPVTSRVQAPDTTAGRRGSRVQRVRHSLRRGTGDDRHGGRVLRRHRRRRRIGHAQSHSARTPLSGSVPQAQILGLSEGRHTIYVHGRDSTGAWGEVSSDTFIVARIGPAVTRCHARPEPDQPCSRDDAPLGHGGCHGPSRPHRRGSRVLRRPGGHPGARLRQRADSQRQRGDRGRGRRRAAREPRPQACHTIRIEAQDDLGHWGATASIQLVIDLAGPVTTSVAVSPNPNNGTLGPGRIPRRRVGDRHRHRRRSEPQRRQVGGGLHRPGGHARLGHGLDDDAGRRRLRPAGRAGLRADPAERDLDSQRRQPHVLRPRARRRGQLGSARHRHAADRQDRARDHGGDPDPRVAPAGPVDDPQRHGRRRLVRRPLRVLPRPGPRHERDGHARQPALDHPLDHRAVPDVGPAALRLRPRARRSGQLGRVDATRAHRHQRVRTAGAAGGSRTGGGHRSACSHRSRLPSSAARRAGSQSRQPARRVSCR